MPLTHHLGSLESSGLIRLAAVEPDLEYLFRHALIQEAAYESILKTDRKRLHLAVGETLERIYADRLDEVSPVLGQHFDAAEDDARALKYLTLAGDLAAKHYALREAIAHYTQALTIAQRSQAPMAALLRARGLAYDISGDFERAQADYETAFQIARRDSDSKAEWQALLALGLLWASRDYTRAGEYYRRAFTLAQTLNEPATLAYTLNRLGNWYMNIGQPTEARPYHQQALAIFETLADAAGIAATSDLLGMTNAIMGDAVQGKRHYERAVALFRELNDPQGLASSLAMLAFLKAATFRPPQESAQTKLAEALHCGEAALEMTRASGWRSGESFARFALAICFAVNSDYRRALEACQAGLAIAREIEHRQWMLANHCALGSIYVELAAWALAIEHLERALALADEIGSLHWKRMVVGHLALAYIGRKELEPAAAVLATVGDLPCEDINARAVGHARVELALARGDAETALQLAGQLGDSAENLSGWGEHNFVRLAVLRAKALAALGRTAEAESVLKAVQPVAVEQGLAARLWRVHVVLGQLYRSQARDAEADQEWTQAQTLIADLARTLPDDALRVQFIRAAAEE